MDLGELDALFKRKIPSDPVGSHLTDPMPSCHLSKYIHEKVLRGSHVYIKEQ